MTVIVRLAAESGSQVRGRQGRQEVEGKSRPAIPSASRFLAIGYREASHEPRFL